MEPYKVPKAPPQMQLKDVRPLMPRLELDLIVLQQEEFIPSTLKDDLYRYLVADRSGSMEFVIWGDRGKATRPGDIIRVKGADAKVRNGTLCLMMNRSGTITRVGQDTFHFVETPNFSEQDLGLPMPNIRGPRANKPMQEPNGPTDPNSHHHHARSASTGAPRPPMPQQQHSRPPFHPYPQQQHRPPPPMTTGEPMHQQLPSFAHQGDFALRGGQRGAYRGGRGRGRGAGIKRANPNMPDPATQQQPPSTRRKVDYSGMN
ncbi:hypothetical protein BC940DRAFT_289794 [Gongronella butleri]|nr:hypothetical protein BC940DRAFT_289794 [Gongronella butleri]